MSEIEIVKGVVLGWALASAGKVALAPAEAIAEYARERIKNRLDRIHQNAEAKARGRRLDVPDRLLFKVLAEGAFTDDAVATDYLGGVLAASGPNDDAGAAIVAQIGRLSSRQLRFHYVVYREIRRLWHDASLNLYEGAEAQRAAIRLSRPDLEAALADEQLFEIGSVVLALARENLIGDRYHYGPPEDDPSAAEEDGRWPLQVAPSALGSELFLWGNGVRGNANALVDPASDLQFLAELPPTPGVALVTPPTPQPPGRQASER